MVNTSCNFTSFQKYLKTLPKFFYTQFNVVKQNVREIKRCTAVIFFYRIIPLPPQPQKKGLKITERRNQM